MRLVATRGGVQDNLISIFGLRTAKVVFSAEEAASFNLPIDHDDTHVWKGDGDFAILLHGNNRREVRRAKHGYKFTKQAADTKRGILTITKSRARRKAKLSMASIFTSSQGKRPLRCHW